MKKVIFFTLALTSLSAFAQTSDAPASEPSSGPSIDTSALSHPTRPSNAAVGNGTPEASVEKAAPAKDKAPAKATKHKTKKVKKKSKKDTQEAAPAN